MTIIGNRYLQGEPILPYASVLAYQNTDIFLDVEFVDHTQTPVIPTSVQLEVDDITNAIAMLGPVTLSPSGSATGSLIYPAFAASWTIQLSASFMTMTYPYQGSQKCQLKFAFTATDSVTGQPFTAPAIAIIELCSSATVSGTF